MKARALALCLLLRASVSCTSHTAVRDLDGATIDPLSSEAPTVLVFVASECPISNQYAPLLHAMAKDFGVRGVRFWLVYPSRLDSATKIRAHQAAFDFGMRALLDPEQRLVRFTGATVTPSVAVLRADHSLAYLGRIDDRYESFGVARPAPTRADLDLALRAVLVGKTSAPARTAAVGYANAD